MLLPVVRGLPWAPAAAVRSIRTAWALCGVSRVPGCLSGG